jgi:hypothetical protein
MQGRGIVGKFFALRVANARSVFKMKEVSHRTSLHETGRLSDPKCSQTVHYRTQRQGGAMPARIAGGRFSQSKLELISVPRRLPLERGAFMSKSRVSHSEYTMNIFYIIGVVVVVIVVAGFLGLHV